MTTKLMILSTDQTMKVSSFESEESWLVENTSIFSKEQIQVKLQFKRKDQLSFMKVYATLLTNA